MLLGGDRERADDLVQDTLERALSCWHQCRADGDRRAWLYKILRNRFLSERDRQRRRGAYDALTEIAEDRPPGVEGGQDVALEHRDLLRAVATLPAQQQSVLSLIGVEDYSYQEAARVLGVPIGTVMSRLSRGRERLRQYMQRERTGQYLIAVAISGRVPSDDRRLEAVGWRGTVKTAQTRTDIAARFTIWSGAPR